MTTLSTVPEAVDLAGYAGDVLQFAITVSDPAYTQGCAWTGHVMSSRDAAVPDAVFAITPDGNGGASVRLTEDQTRALVDLAPAKQPRATAARRYSGSYDIQVARVGFTRTLVQGTLTVDLDVTRVAP